VRREALSSRSKGGGTRLARSGGGESNFEGEKSGSLPLSSSRHKRKEKRKGPCCPSARSVSWGLSEGGGEILPCLSIAKGKKKGGGKKGMGFLLLWSRRGRRG